MKFHLLIPACLLLAVIVFAMFAFPNQPQTLQANRYDYAVGIATFSCRDFSTSQDLAIKLPIDFDAKSHGPINSANDESCFATVQIRYTLTDQARIQRTTPNQALSDNDIEIGRYLLRDSHHWGLIREYGVYRDENGFWLGFPNHIRHRLENRDPHRVASESIETILKAYFPYDASYQRQTLIEHNAISIPDK